MIPTASGVVVQRLRAVVDASSVDPVDHPTPRHPRALVDHVCLNGRPSADAPPSRGAFAEPV